MQVYSSSFIFATEQFQNGLHFFGKQSLALSIGLFFLFLVAWIPTQNWIRFFPFIWGVGVLGLALTLIPGVGVSVGGSRRWLNLGLTRFEPSELVKILVPWLFAFLYSHWDEADHWTKRPPAWMLWLSPLFLLLLQPDFGTFALIIFILLLMLFVVGFAWKYFAWMAVCLIPAFTFLIVRYPYRLARVLAFINPWADPANSGFQLIQSLLSVRNGGFWGQGLGAGQGKLFFLPEAHTDFTLAVLAEETGFLGVCIVFALYGFVFLRSLQIGLNARDNTQRLVVLGVSFLFGLNTLFNIAVVLGMLPTKGLTLPFLSYGGSSLICYCIAFGWVLNVERQSELT